MSQIHYVVYFDTETKGWEIDYGTTEARFPEGHLYRGDDEGWELPNAFADEMLVKELIQAIKK